VANHRESLAGGSPKDNIYPLTAYSGPQPDLGSGQPGNRLRQHDATREVVFVDSTMDRVDFNSGHDIETGLFEAQTKAPSSREQVDSDWSWHPQAPASKYQLTRLWRSCRSDFFRAGLGRKRVGLRADLWISSDIAKRS
jgi:hypothetical protein